MIFSKSAIAVVVLMLGASVQVEAHATIAPMLGLGRIPQRNDVQRPTDAKPCGNVDISSTFDTTESIAVKSDRTFSAFVQNYNTGVDGSRQIVKALFDPTGTGNNFRDLKILINGENSPTENSQEKLFFQLRGGVDCKGGASKTKCLVSLKTAGGFGNCIVVEQHKQTSARRGMEKARRPAGH